MPRRPQPGRLTDENVGDALPRAKPYTLRDGNGLGLVVQVSGTKSWILKYKIGRKSHTKGLGHYPDVGIKEARTEVTKFRNKRTLEGASTPQRRDDAAVIPMQAHEVGARIRATRSIYDKGQKEVGEKLGCTKVTVSRYESGHREMNYDTLARFAIAYNITTDWLLLGYLDGVALPIKKALQDFAPTLVKSRP